jgi:hypothetical protein
MVTILTTSLTFTNPTFCPCSVFVFCMDLGEKKTAIIFLYDIN